jgi:ADP-ribose pyrophosphatase YjhB (NUDIX family)
VARRSAFGGADEPGKKVGVTEVVPLASSRHESPNRVFVKTSWERRHPAGRRHLAAVTGPASVLEKLQSTMLWTIRLWQPEASEVCSRLEASAPGGAALRISGMCRCLAPRNDGKRGSSHFGKGLAFRSSNGAASERLEAVAEDAVFPGEGISGFDRIAIFFPPVVSACRPKGLVDGGKAVEHLFKELHGPLAPLIDAVKMDQHLIFEFVAHPVAFSALRFMADETYNYTRGEAAWLLFDPESGIPVAHRCRKFAAPAGSRRYGGVEATLRTLAGVGTGLHGTAGSARLRAMETKTTPRGPSVLLIPEGDNRERQVCPDCGFINYENPKIVVGSVVVWEDRFLLCRRAIDPRLGFWTLPAGFMEVNESTEEAAAREAWEEAQARIAIDGLLAVYNISRISQVQLIYRAHLLTPEIGAGPESLEVALFRWSEIPWADIAFPTVKWALDHFREAMATQDFTTRGNPVI